MMKETMKKSMKYAGKGLGKVIGKKPLVIKIGGAILTQKSALYSLLAVIKKLPDQAVVLVHGGGCVVDDMLKQSGFTTEKKNGLRITPKTQIPVISGALAGNVNKAIVASAASLKLSAVGLSLGDGEMVQCQLSPLQLGQVGEPSPYNSSLLDTLLKAKFL